LKEEEKNDLKVQHQLPEMMRKQQNPLVLAYPMPIAVPFPPLYKMYQLPTAIPYPRIPMCLSIPNRQYY